MNLQHIFSPLFYAEKLDSQQQQPLSMRICINRQQSPCNPTTPALKTESHPYFQSLSGSIRTPEVINQFLFECPSTHHPGFKQTSKPAINDSILIEDKENCYISNRPSNVPTSRNQPSRCQNHQKDKAEYYLTSEGGELFTYCNRCASSLIAQGFKVDRIVQNLALTSVTTPAQHSPQLMNRKQELDQIWLFFQKIYQQALHKKNKTDASIFSCQGFFNEQIQEINIYFQQLHNYLEVLKNRFYNNILHQKQMMIKTSEEWSRVLSQVLTEIESIECDIRINQEGVILIDDKEYKELVQALSGHLKQYFTITDSWKIESLPQRKFIVPPVQEMEETIRNAMTSMCRTPRTSLIKDRVETKTMGKSNSCIFVENRGVLEKKYSVMGRIE